jgi:hypothetical protein
MRSAIDRPICRRPQGDPRPLAIDRKKIAKPGGPWGGAWEPKGGSSEISRGLRWSCRARMMILFALQGHLARGDPSLSVLMNAAFTCRFASKGSALFVHCSPRSFARSACPCAADVSEELLEAHALVCDLGHRITLCDLQPMVPRKKAELVAVFHAGNDRRKF